MIDDGDDTYVNGKRIGGLTGWPCSLNLLPKAD